MTKLVYLDDSYLFELEALIFEIRETEMGQAVILNQTIFYPQGGGQPADKGIINTGDAAFEVTDTRLDESGIVLHYGEYTTEKTFEKGEGVVIKIEKERRVLNMKLHSAGHLLDCAVMKLGLNLKPTKGYHFAAGSYVEYAGKVESGNELIHEIEVVVNDLIDNDLKVLALDLSNEEAKKQGVWAPEGKPARIVSFAGFPPCGCGGTHVISSKEIGYIKIRKIKHKKGNTKISYSLI